MIRRFDSDVQEKQPFTIFQAETKIMNSTEILKKYVFCN